MISQIWQFFSLPTLDDRLQPSAKKLDIIKRSSPSKWGTLEFKFYIVVFAVAVPLMYKTAMDASNETNPNFPRFQHLLSDGWMMGRKVDNSDSQYRFFRDNFILLIGLMLGHLALKRLVVLSKLTNKIGFDFMFGLLFLFGAHGFSAAKILLHLMVNFTLCKIPNTKVATACCWIYGVGTLFLNDWYWNVPFSAVSEKLRFLDGFHGIIPRWDVFFNFTLLRMLSFSLDYIHRKASPDLGKKQEDKSSEGGLFSDKERLNANHEIDQYNMFNYLAYVTYTPLFIAGPIITFNDYLYQCSFTLPSIDFKKTMIYGARLGFCLLTMEFLLHFMYVVAVSKTRAWEGNTPFQISMIGLFNLNIIWLKLLIPWRLFRFWALLDGIDPPENMIRCMDNNYSAMAFWRAWHRSFNRWVIKYIYIPMGGSNNRVLTSLMVFSFVAIWHDIELKLLIWGWLIVFALLPEITLTQVCKPLSDKWWFRHFCGIGAVLNIWMMMLANLYGFCLGHDGTAMLLKEVFSTLQGWQFFVVASFCLFVGVQVMFELRESEKRQGIDVRC